MNKDKNKENLGCLIIGLLVIGIISPIFLSYLYPNYGLVGFVIIILISIGLGYFFYKKGKLKGKKILFLVLMIIYSIAGLYFVNIGFSSKSDYEKMFDKQIQNAKQSLKRSDMELSSKILFDSIEIVAYSNNEMKNQYMTLINRYFKLLMDNKEYTEVINTELNDKLIGDSFNLLKNTATIELLQINLDSILKKELEYKTDLAYKNKYENVIQLADSSMRFLNNENFDAKYISQPDKTLQLIKYNLPQLHYEYILYSFEATQLHTIADGAIPMYLDYLNDLKVISALFEKEDSLYKISTLDDDIKLKDRISEKINTAMLGYASYGQPTSLATFKYVAESHLKKTLNDPSSLEIVEWEYKPTRTKLGYIYPMKVRATNAFGALIMKV